MIKFFLGKFVQRKRWFAEGGWSLRARTSGWGYPYTRGATVEKNPDVFTDAKT